jgi:hypothetical protein
MEIVISVFLGLGLAASAGLRVFLPLLFANIASLFGWINFSDGFAWLGSWPAFAVFLTASIAEIAAYYFPFIDNALDTIAVPLSFISGTILSVSFVTDMNPMLQWTLGIIAGGGTASLIKTASGAVRLGSSSTTAGLGNWIVSSAENIGSFILSLLSFLIPLIAGAISLLIIAYAVQRIFLLKKQN